MCQPAAVHSGTRGQARVNPANQNKDSSYRGLTFSTATLAAPRPDQRRVKTVVDEGTTPPPQSKPKKLTAADRLKIAKFILENAVKDERHFEQMGKDYGHEVPGRLNRLCRVLFDQSVTPDQLHRSGRRHYVAKILSKLQELAGDQFSELELPKFMQQ